MADTIQPFPQPSGLPDIAQNVTSTDIPFPQPLNVSLGAQNVSPSLVPFPVPSEEAFVSAVANLTLSTISSTLPTSTTTISRAARTSLSTKVEESTAAWTRMPFNSTDEVEWLLGGPDEWNTTFNGTFGNSTFGNGTMEDSGNIFEQRPWLLWLLIGLGVLLIVCAAVTLLLCFLCKKKKNTQQEQAPLAAPSPTSEHRPKSWLPCCTVCVEKLKKNKADSKQPNDAALNPYNRPPLPPIGASQSIAAGEMDGYQGGHLPAQRLAPLKRNSVFDQFSNPQMLGANIQGLKGVPMIYVQTKDMRQLPLPQLD